MVKQEGLGTQLRQAWGVGGGGRGREGGEGREVAWPEVAKGLRLILSQLPCPSPPSLGAPPSGVLRLPFPASAYRSSYLDSAWRGLGVGGDMLACPLVSVRPALHQVQTQPALPTNLGGGARACPNLQMGK